MSKDPHAILELEPGADRAALKKAYFAKIRQFPPDKAPEDFKAIRAAYETLLKTASSSKSSDLRYLSFEQNSSDTPMDLMRKIKTSSGSLSVSQLIRFTF